MQTKDQLLKNLQQHALVKEKVLLSSGQTAEYYVDAKRALLWADTFKLCGQLVAAKANQLGATAVDGLTMGADPVAMSSLTSENSDLKAFAVRKVKKEHGMQRWVEGPLLTDSDKCLVVEDVVTTGTSTLKAIECLRMERLKIVGVVCVVDRLAGGGEAIAAVIEPAPFISLLTIDDIYPDRPDR